MRVEKNVDVRRWLSRITVPGYRRARALRLGAAGVFAVLAVVSAVLPLFHHDPTVVVAQRDIPAGAVVRPEDVAVVAIPESLQPNHAYTDPAELEGQVAVAAISAGEILTPTRFIGPELTARLGADAEPEIADPTMVPLTVADPAIVPLLHHGDSISILTWADTKEEPRTVAEHARVVLPGTGGSGEPGESSGSRGRSHQATILVVLPASQAHTVAAAALHGPLTVVITGARAGSH